MKYIGLLYYDPDFSYVEYCKNRSLKDTLIYLSTSFQYNISLQEHYNNIDFFIVIGEDDVLELDKPNVKQFINDVIEIKYIGDFIKENMWI